MAPKKRRGRKLMDEAPSTHSFEISNASGAGECGESESDVVSSSLNQEEQPVTVSPVVGDRKLSSAVLVLENCLLPNSQRASVTSPGSFPLEGATPKLQPVPTARQRASSIKDDAGDGSFTSLAPFGVTDKEEVELESSSYHVPKPKRATMVRRKKQKLKTVLQIVPSQLDTGVRSSEAEQNMHVMAEHGVGIEASVMHRTNLELGAESLQLGDEKVFEAENFVSVKKRKAGAKKEKRVGKRRKSDHGAGTVGVVEPVAEDEENGTTWMVSPSGGDEERVILKRQRKVAVSQDLMFTDASATGLLNADIRVTPECPGYAPSEFQNSSKQSIAQDKVIDGEQTVAAVETEVGISRPDALGTEVVVKKRWTRKLGKRMAKNISLDISETDTVETAVLPVKKRPRFKRKSLKLEENLEPSRAIVSAPVSTRVTRSRSNGNGGTPLQIDGSRNVTVNTSEETAKTNLPGTCEEDICLQTMAVEGGSAGNREIENTEKELPCDADLHSTGVKIEEADVQLVISQETTPETYTEPTHVTSALESLNTGFVDNGNSSTEIAADSSAVSSYTISSIQETSEQRDSVAQHSSDERITAVPDWDDNSLQKTSTSLPETMSLHVSIELALNDQRGESSSLELSRDNENVIPSVALDNGNEPLASGVVCLETPRPEKLLPCDDLSNSTGCRIKKPLSSNTDVNLCKSLNNEDLLFISSSANSTALAESGSLAIRDGSDEFSVRNRTDSVGDSCLDMASKPIEAVLSSAVGPVSLSVGSDGVLIAAEHSSSVQQTSNVPKVDRRNESGGEPSEICSEGTRDQNLQRNLPASDILDTSKTKSDTSEAMEDLPGHSTSDGLKLDAKTVAKDASCNADHRKSSEGVVAEEAGFVPLKKRRLRMAESASEFVAIDVKCSVSSDATNQSSELCAQSAVCIGGSTTGVKEPSSASALSASTLHDADAIARQRKYVGAHVSTAGGLPGAVVRASQMGARAFALFIKPQKTWTPTPLDEQEASDFRELLKEKGYLPSMVVPHGSYLLNCGASNAEHLRRSREALVDDLRRCQLLGLSLFNFHPGSFTDPDSADECIDRVAESINYAHSIVPDVITVIENSCGEMNAVGGSFSQLKQIIDKVTDKSRIGICLDTCHAFASGYDLRAKSGYVRMMEDFDTTIGREFLKAVHINDSKDDLGSRLDHHASIGKGKIGLPGFQVLMADRSLENIPIILETPLSGHKHEIELLYSFVSSVE